MDWAEQYRPLHVQEIVGNGPAIRQMVEWAKNWSQKSKPLILYGKPGTGKTSSAYALAHDMGWDVVELNASDERTRAAIDRIAGSSAMTASLSGASRKLIVLDEADHLHGTADRGGAKAIIDIIKQTRQPIILIANDIYALPQELKARGELVQFRALQARSILPRLKYIAAAEGVKCSDAALSDIAASADGDMRAAINMLYAAAIGKAAVGECDVFSTKKDERSSIFDLISAIFAGRREEDLISQSSEVNDTPDAIEQWIEANVHYLPDPESLAEGYRYLSRADEYIGLTYRRQYYILWRYANALMLLGVAYAARGRGLRARILSPPRWKRMSASRKQKTIRNNLFKKLSEEMHIQQSTLRETYLTPLAMMVERDPETFTAEFELDEDELGLLINDRLRAAEIVKELAKRAKADEKQRTVPKQKEEKKVNAGNQSSLPGL